MTSINWSTSTYIITMVPVNILGDVYPNKSIGYLNIIIKCVMLTSDISNVANTRTNKDVVHFDIVFSNMKLENIKYTQCINLYSMWLYTCTCICIL